MITKGAFLFLFTLCGTSFSQTIQKSTFSSFHSTSPNDSLIVTAGQVVSGESSNPEVWHGYLPLQWSLLSVDDNSPLTIKVYPNPASDNIQVEIEGLSNELTGLSILNMQGQVVLEENIQSSKFSINIEDLADGIYVIQLKSHSTLIVSQRIVKQ